MSGMETMKQYRRFLVILGLAAAAVLVPVSTAPASVELVVNGGFESGNFTGWTPWGNTASVRVDTTNAVHSGDYGAVFGEPGLGGIEQSLVTTQGQEYLLSFWFVNNVPEESTARNMVRVVSWGGEMLFVDDGETAEASGQTFTGPVLIARQSILKEISFERRTFESKKKL